MMHQSQWQPQPDITLHDGNPIESDRDFFAPPPPEIGKIITADTSLKTDEKGRPLSSVLTLALVIALIAGVAGQGLLIYFQLDRESSWQTVLVIVTLSIAVLSICGLRFTRFCSYVGERGIIEYKLTGSREQTTSRLFLFKNAEDLFTGTIRKYYNGIYIGTTYTYCWKQKKAKVFTLRGTYNERKKRSREFKRWQYICAAESTRSDYRWQLISPQLERLGFVEFPTGVKNPQRVRIGDGFIEFIQKDNSQHKVAVSEMKDITLGDGLFRFVHQDANWWSGKGKYALSYSKLPNAQLFLFCLDRLTGIRWS